MLGGKLKICGLKKSVVVLSAVKLKVGYPESTNRLKVGSLRTVIS